MTVDRAFLLSHASYGVLGLLIHLSPQLSASIVHTKPLCEQILQQTPPTLTIYLKLNILPELMCKSVSNSRQLRHLTCKLFSNGIHDQGRSQDFINGGAKMTRARVKILEPEVTPTN